MFKLEFYQGRTPAPFNVPHPEMPSRTFATIQEAHSAAREFCTKGPTGTWGDYNTYDDFYWRRDGNALTQIVVTSTP